MKIFIITNIAFPYGMAPANRIRCYAKAISYAGLETEVLVYRRTERYGKIPQNTQAIGECEGVYFRYVSGTPMRGRNVFIRQVEDRFDKLKLLKILSREMTPGDILFLYNGFDVDFNIMLTKFAHRHRCKIAVDLCELPYGTGAETKRVQKKRAKVTGRLYPRLDGIVSISDALVEYASKYINKECRLIKVPIMVDYDFYSLEDMSFDEANPFIFHAGTLTEQKDGILGMIEAFGIACNKLPKNINFYLTGQKESSPYCEQIDALIKKYSLNKRLRFTGFLSEETLRDLLKRASLVIINKYHTQQNRYCFSTKLGEYMAAGKPVIITAIGEAVNWLTDMKDSYMVEPENIPALASTIVYAFDNEDERQRIGKVARMTCKDSFDYKIYGSKLASFLYSL